MARRIDWTGIFPPIATPFTREGELDEAAFGEVVEQHIADGCHGIIVAGCTGEWFSLDDAERCRIFEIAVDVAKGRVPIVAGTSAMNTRAAVKLQKAAKDLGCAGSMTLAPPFLLPFENEVVHFFRRLSAVGLPIMLYNNPPRGCMNFTASLIGKLLEFDEIVSIKDSVNELPQNIDTLRAHADEIAIFAGREGYLLPAIQRGAVGSVAMITNILGGHVVEYYDHLLAGRWEEARRPQQLIDDAYAVIQGKSVKLTRATGHWSVLKTCMNVLGRNGGYMREPYLPVLDEDIPKIADALAKIGLTPENMAHPVAAE